MIPTSTEEARAVEPSPQATRNRDSLLSAYRTEIAIAVAMVILGLAVGSQVPQALSWGNFSNITQAGAPLIIMSLGVLLVVITGGIDLSVGSVFSLTGMVTAQVMASGFGGITSSLAGLAVGLLFGSINGLLVTVAGLAPFVVTLITFAVAGSLAFIVTNGRSMPACSLHAAATALERRTRRPQGSQLPNWRSVTVPNSAVSMRAWLLRRHCRRSPSRRSEPKCISPIASGVPDPSDASDLQSAPAAQLTTRRGRPSGGLAPFYDAPLHPSANAAIDLEISPRQREPAPRRGATASIWPMACPARKANNTRNAE